MKIEEKICWGKSACVSTGNSSREKEKKTERQSKMERKRDQRTKQGKIKELMSGCKSD